MLIMKIVFKWTDVVDSKIMEWKHTEMWSLRFYQFYVNIRRVNGLVSSLQ